MAAKVLTFKHPDMEPVVIHVDGGFTIWQVAAVGFTSAVVAVIVALTLAAV